MSQSPTSMLSTNTGGKTIKAVILQKNVLLRLRLDAERLNLYKLSQAYAFTEQVC